MCGIAGWIGQLPDSELVSARLAALLRHRGPDSHGQQHWPDAALVHTRLSILDLSPSGSQPLANEDHTVWVVLNGEIYNHRELRRDVESRGHHVEGRSDTAVLPHLYEEYGSGCIEKLRGMFAIAIYDTRARRLLLARDRFGIKPLFYAVGPDRISFASELRAIREIPGVDTRPDPQAVSDFVGLFYIPAPQTFYRGIAALMPGTVLDAHLRHDHPEFEVRRYHRWTIHPDFTLSRAAAAERAGDLVRTAVTRQIESDVPLGSMLSGGIDSSLISAAAQAVNGGVRTFNVRFPDREYDETSAALTVAQHIGSTHETLELDAIPGTWEHIVGLLQHAGQPFADTSVFAAHAVCALMRRRVTVALAGDGGDEGFGGYDTYWRIARISRLRSVPGLLRSMSTVLQPLGALGVVPGALPQRAADLASDDDPAMMQSLLSALSPRLHRKLCGDAGALPLRRLFEPEWTIDVPRRVSRLEVRSARLTELLIRLTLPNDFLYKVDIASMRESLEVRVPMLDEDLIDFALTLPHRLKERDRTTKLVLRDVASRQLPATIASKPKAGFAVPIDTWVDENFRAELKRTLLDRSSPVSDVLDRSVYAPWVEAFCDRQPQHELSRAGLYRTTIMLLALHLALVGAPAASIS